MDMSFSSVSWCPPWYVSWSILGMLVFPLVVIPALRKQTVSLSVSPMLIGLTPLFHGCVLAFLGLRSVFLGMTLAGSDSRVVLSAGLGEAQTVLIFAAVISAVVLIFAIVIAQRAAAQIGDQTCVTTGRGSATAISVVGAILVLGVFAVTLTAMNSAGEVRKVLCNLSIAGAWLSGGLVLAAIFTSVWVVSRVARATPPSRVHRSRRSLAMALGFVVATGAASWFLRAWLVGMAINGG